MRNLKKVLALALAVVMLVGMMVVGVSAADYKDEASIGADYATAVDVTTAIGIFQGTSGVFNPQKGLTRAEATKVIAYLNLTEANAKKLSTGAKPFNDVELDHWAAGTIAYCKDLGIISGSAGNFNPSGELDGFSFAKMLLVALGYNADVEGFKGDTWTSGVNAAALRAGLMDGLSIDLKNPITREQAAQMVFNALQATTVEYSGGTKVVLPDGTTMTSGGTRDYVASPATTGYKTLANGTASGNDAYVQLCEALYPALKLCTVGTTDAWGFNVVQWYMGNTCSATTVVANQVTDTVIAHWEGQDVGYVSAADIYNLGIPAVTVAGYDYAYMTFIENGEANGAGFAYNYKGVTTLPAFYYAYNGADVTIVYTATGTYNCIVKYALPGIVDSVNATADTMVVKIYNGDGTYTAKTIANPGYAKGDAVMVYLAGNVATNLTSITASTVVLGLDTPTKVTGTLAYVFGENGASVNSFSVNGAQLWLGSSNLAKMNLDVDAALAANTYGIGAAYDFYLYNGYVVGTDKVATNVTSVLNETVVMGLDTQYTAVDPATGATYYFAKVLRMDGTVEVIRTQNIIAVAANTFYKLGTNSKGITVAALGAASAASTDTWTYTVTDVDAENLKTDALLGVADMWDYAASSAAATIGTAYVTNDTAVIYWDAATGTATVVKGAHDKALDAGTKVIVSKDTAINYHADVIIIPEAYDTATAGTALVWATSTAVYTRMAADGITPIYGIAVYALDGTASYVEVDTLPTAGLSSYTVDNGIYTFAPFTGFATATNAKGGVYAFADKAASVYRNLLTIDGDSTADIVTLDASAAKIVDFTGNGIDTLAELVAVGATLDCYVIVNAAGTAVTNIVVKNITAKT